MKLARPLLVLWLLVASGSALAQAGKLSIGVWGSGVLMNGTTTVDSANGVDVKFDSGWGVGGTLGYGFTNLLEGEVSVFNLWSKGALDVYGQKAIDLGSLEMRPVSLLLKIHPLHPGFLDVWAGVGGAWVWMGNLSSDDLTASGIGAITVKSKGAFEAALGVDLTLLGLLSFGVDGRYLPLKVDSYGASGSTQTLKLNPVILSAGFRLKL